MATLQVPKLKKRKWGKPKEGESLKMLAAGSLAFAKAYSSVEKLEHQLEAEIQKDRESIPKTGLARWQKKGSKILMKKFFLLFIVALTIIDCTLVLGELILDLHHVKDILKMSSESANAFISKLQETYPDKFINLNKHNIEEFYAMVLSAKLVWTHKSSQTSVPKLNNVLHLPAGSHRDSQMTDNSTNQNGLQTGFKSGMNSRTDDSSESNRSSLDPVSVIPTVHSSQMCGTPDCQSLEESISNVLHCTSMTIGIILVTWIVLKVVCFGKELLERKLEVFDAFVVMVSFIVDLVFLKEMSIYSIQEFVFILAFMLPWRVIRVSNSLVVAVRDHEHFRLKLLFQQKKKVESENKMLKSDRDNYREQVESLKKLCLDENIDDWKIFQAITRQPLQTGKGIMGSFASLAFGGALGPSKSSSFWSVLGTPRLRRGKSMDILENKKVKPEGKTEQHKGRILNFLGSSTDFFKGKSKNGKQLSLDCDPAFGLAMFKNSNGNNNRKLQRTETIDTVSTDTSNEGHGDPIRRMCNGNNGMSRQDTNDSSVFEEDRNGSVRLETRLTIERTRSEEDKRSPPLIRFKHGTRNSLTVIMTSDTSVTPETSEEVEVEKTGVEDYGR